MSKLKYIIKDGKKTYTLKDSPDAKDAHYKFIKLKDVKEAQ